MAKILVIDDSPTVAGMLQRFLTREGHQVMVAPDGAIGLDLTRQLSPDLVVLDRVLPALGGLEVCRVIKTDPATASIKVLMLTGTADDDVRRAATDAGVNALLTKDGGLPPVIDTIKALLEGLPVP